MVLLNGNTWPPGYRFLRAMKQTLTDGFWKDPFLIKRKIVHQRCQLQKLREMKKTVFSFRGLSSLLKRRLGTVWPEIFLRTKCPRLTHYVLILYLENAWFEYYIVNLKLKQKNSFLYLFLFIYTWINLSIFLKIAKFSNSGHTDSTEQENLSFIGRIMSDKKTKNEICKARSTAIFNVRIYLFIFLKINLCQCLYFPFSTHKQCILSRLYTTAMLRLPKKFPQIFCNSVINSPKVKIFNFLCTWVRKSD
jgi:hypothetical protein